MEAADPAQPAHRRDDSADCARGSAPGLRNSAADVAIRNPPGNRSADPIPQSAFRAAESAARAILAGERSIDAAARSICPAERPILSAERPIDPATEFRVDAERLHVPVEESAVNATAWSRLRWDRADVDAHTALDQG